MADEQPQSIADRIAALKLNQVGRAPGSAPPSYAQVTNGTGRRPPPPPPPRPALPARPQSVNVPPPQDHGTVSNGRIGNLPEQNPSNGMDGISRPALPPRTSTQSSRKPNLPSRTPSEVTSPALPPRRPSEAQSSDDRRPSNYSMTRRGSNESTSSFGTALSATSSASQTVKAPTFDPSSLPALPPKRTQEEKDADYKKHNSGAAAAKRFSLPQTKSWSNIGQKQTGTTPPPPPRPAVRASQTEAIQEEPAQPPLPLRQREPVSPAAARQRETIAPPPRKSALGMGFGNAQIVPPPLPGSRPGSTTQSASSPPPIPTASRPDLAALQASKPKPVATPTATSRGPPGTCLLCRDFSGPDNHAVRFPRQSLPSSDIVWLAHQLTAPFPSETDKARAIFTWLHHNVEYDVVAFFNNNVRPSTPQSTLQTGLAVCEGYAGLFAALAMKIGLEAYVVSGHGKGYGYSALAPGSPFPPYSAGHAWNVVKIDGGQWKLIDCCWGAGNVGGKNQPYNKSFSPERFTQPNDEFGLDHFPGDKTKQFRNDGGIVSWEEYILGNKNGCGAFFFNGFVAEEGLTSTSFQPVDGKIQLSRIPGPTLRFSFQKVCPHWDPVRCGKGAYYLYVLALDALDGTQRNHIPFETNGDVWWCDVPVADLGRPGMGVQIFSVTNFDGADGRGLTIERYRERKGRCAYAFGGVCKWEIVG